jgi:2-methylcitrate dehydratase PrpD
MTTDVDANTSFHTAQLAKFVAELNTETLPTAVRTRLAQCLLDFIAVASGGRQLADSSPASWDSCGRIDSPDVGALIERIDLVVDNDISPAGAVLTWRTADADLATVRVDSPSGEPGTDLTWNTVEAKFHGLTDGVLGDIALTVALWIKALPHPNPVRNLGLLLRNSPAAHTSGPLTPSTTGH